MSLAYEYIDDSLEDYIKRTPNRDKLTMVQIGMQMLEAIE